MLKVEEPIWTRSSLGCHVAPIKNGSSKSPISANGIHRNCIVRIHTTSRELARGEARAYLLPRPGRTRLPRRLGYTRLPRPVRVRLWGGWVRNGIKVYNLYYRLPRPLGYTRLPRPVRVRSWGGWVRNGITIRKSGLYSFTRVAYSQPLLFPFCHLIYGAVPYLRVFRAPTEP
jgi:hypothetical protein